MPTSRDAGVFPHWAGARGHAKTTKPAGFAGRRALGGLLRFVNYALFCTHFGIRQAQSGLTRIKVLRSASAALAAAIFADMRVRLRYMVNLARFS